MSARKKPAPAELRTIGMFNGGLTPLEEAQRLKDEEQGRARPPADRSDFGVRDAMVDTAIRWLGHDILAEGDDIVLVEGSKGAVLSVVYGRAGHAPRKTIDLKLSSAHLKKLRSMFK